MLIPQASVLVSGGPTVTLARMLRAAARNGALDALSPPQRGELLDLADAFETAACAWLASGARNARTQGPDAAAMAGSAPTGRAAPSGMTTTEAAAMLGVAGAGPSARRRRAGPPPRRTVAARPGRRARRARPPRRRVVISKALQRFEIKDTARGEVTAVFATLNVVDRDGDVTVAGAFEEGAPVRISAYGHTSWSGALPVGKGTIRTVGDQAILDGQFFLDTTAGRDTFTVVKELGELGEWSYGFDILDYGHGTQNGQPVRVLKRLRVFEVSPVLLGAGIGTRTLAAKGLDTPGLSVADRAELERAQLHLIRGRVQRDVDARKVRTELRALAVKHGAELAYAETAAADVDPALVAAAALGAEHTAAQLDLPAAPTVRWYVEAPEHTPERARREAQSDPAGRVLYARAIDARGLGRRPAAQPGGGLRDGRARSARTWPGATRTAPSSSSSRPAGTCAAHRCAPAH